MPESINRGRALRTARDVLRTICVCGDTDSEHTPLGGARYGACCEVGCECQRFKPAPLRVAWLTRAERSSPK